MVVVKVNISSGIEPFSQMKIDLQCGHWPIAQWEDLHRQITFQYNEQFPKANPTVSFLKKRFGSLVKLSARQTDLAPHPVPKGGTALMYQGFCLGLSRVRTKQQMGR
jgi:hypothetical protein